MAPLESLARPERSTGVTPLTGTNPALAHPAAGRPPPLLILPQNLIQNGLYAPSPFTDRNDHRQSAAFDQAVSNALAGASELTEREVKAALLFYCPFFVPLRCRFPAPNPPEQQIIHTLFYSPSLGYSRRLLQATRRPLFGFSLRFSSWWLRVVGPSQLCEVNAQNVWAKLAAHGRATLGPFPEQPEPSRRSSGVHYTAAV